MKIGLSLSLCVKDIIEGKVAINDVACIVSNTCIRNDQDWEEVYHSYAQHYWRSAPELALQVFRELTRNWNDYDCSRLVQPRLLHGNYQHKSFPHWIDVPDQRYGYGDPRTDRSITADQRAAKLFGREPLGEAA